MDQKTWKATAVTKLNEEKVVRLTAELENKVRWLTSSSEVLEWRVIPSDLSLIVFLLLLEFIIWSCGPSLITVNLVWVFHRCDKKIDSKI